MPYRAESWDREGDPVVRFRIVCRPARGTEGARAVPRTGRAKRRLFGFGFGLGLSRGR